MGRETTGAVLGFIYAREHEGIVDRVRVDARKPCTRDRARSIVLHVHAGLGLLTRKHNVRQRRRGLS